MEGKKAAEGGKVDYCLRIKGKSEVFLEAKRPGEDLEKHQEQLLDYSFREGVDLAILSNGIFWWFYLPRKKGHWKERKFYAIDIMQQAAHEIAEKFTQLLSRNNVQSGEALQNAKYIYEQLDRQKKIDETLPRAWNKIITEADSRLIDLLVDNTESMCGFRPEIEDVKNMIINFKERLFLSEIPVSKAEQKPPKPDGTKERRIKFFEGLIQKTNDKTNLFSKVKHSGKDGWITAGIGKYGVGLGYVILKNKSKVELWIGIPGEHDKNKAIFDTLFKQKDEVEKEVGFTLDWYRNDEKISSAIRKWFDEGGLDYQESWPELQEKMVDAMVQFEKAFKQRLEFIP